MIRHTPRSSVSRSKAQRRLIVSALVAIFLASATIIGAASIPGLDWWFSSPADTNWTNKPVEEIRRAADKGEPAAEFYLGRAWFFGVSGKRDMQQSLDWVRRSADQGYPQAQLVLARFHFLGLVVPQDNDQGFRWTTRAAEHGHSDAMALLGRAYEYGEGTARDAQKGLQSFQSAEKAGSRIATKWMGDFYVRGEARTVRRTNYVEALRCYERAASNGLVSAGLAAADMCSKGLGTPPDFARAISWLRHFKDRGSPEVFERLARAYADGSAEPRDSSETPTELIRRAAETRCVAVEAAGEQSWGFNVSSDLISDCDQLSNRYRFGIGTVRDYFAAAQWAWQSYREHLHRTANADDPTRERSSTHQFDRYLKGEVPAFFPDDRLWQQAVRIAHDALDQNRPEAWNQIGEFYRDGSVLTPKNPARAWAWFSRAADLGYVPARSAVQSIEKDLTASEIRAAHEIWLPQAIASMRQ